MTMTKLSMLCIALALAVVSSTAHAQSPAPAEAEATTTPENSEDATHAREVFQAGQVAFAEGRFAEAASLWQRSYELAQRPAILYNIGTALDRSGDETGALEYYGRYLEAEPDAANGAYIRSRVDVLNSRAADGGAAAHSSDGEGTAPDPSPETQATAPTPGANPAPAIALFSVAGAAGVTGLVLGLRALSQQSDLESSCPDGLCSEDLRSDVDRMGRMALAADILLGVSAAAALGGLIAAIMGSKSSDELPVEASCTGDGCRMQLRGSF